MDEEEGFGPAFWAMLILGHADSGHHRRAGLFHGGRRGRHGGTMKRGRPNKRTDLVALRATVIGELQRLATEGRAPMQIDYDVQKRAGPTIKNVLDHLKMSWPDLVAAAGLRMPRMPQHEAKRRAYRTAPERGTWLAGSMSEFLNRHERADLDDRYSTALAVSPTPTRVETLIGRTLAGEPCRITREYRMVR